MSDPTPDPNPLAGLEAFEVTPDWVKGPAANFNQHSGEVPRGRGDRDRDHDRRGPRRPGGSGSGSGSGRSDQRPGGPGGPGRPGGPGGPGGPRRDRDRDRSRGGPPHQGYGAPSGPPPVGPAAVDVVFAPEEKGFAAMVEAMKHSGKAYALFDLARLILSKPERHVVRLTRLAPAAGGPAPSFNYIEVSESAFLDRGEAVRHLLQRQRDLVMREVKTPIDPPKGNFTFVNRCGVTGVWLGPPNYHEYQARLVRHQQAQVRQLSFEQFKSRIETTRDPEAVQAWLRSMSSKTEFLCRCCEAPAEQSGERRAASGEATSPTAVAAQELARATPAAAADSGAVESAVAETAPAAAPAPEPAPSEEPAAPAAAAAPAQPVVFATLRELEQHIERVHLDQFLVVLPEVTLTGNGARQSAQKGIAAAVRLAWESERRFPLKTVNLLRPRLQREGFFFFKHPNGVTYITRMRPKRFVAGEELTERVQKIIACLRAPQGCTRKQLLEKFLPAPAPVAAMPADPAVPLVGPDGTLVAATPAASLPPPPVKVPTAVIQELETKLAPDLHWLLREGYAVEFADGRLWAMEERRPEPPRPAKAAKAEIEPAPAATTEAAAPVESTGAEAAASTAEPTADGPASAETADALPESPAAEVAAEPPPASGPSPEPAAGPL